MIDLSSTDIRATFCECKALPIKNKEGKVISHGKQTMRINFNIGENDYSIAVHSHFSEKPIKLNLIERLYMVVIKVKDDDGNNMFIKVNSNSFKKRLGISEISFKIVQTNDFNKVNRSVAEVFRNILCKPKESFYVDATKSDCAHELGVLFKYRGRPFEGQFKDGKVHGYGVEFYPDGSIQYAGQYKDGKRHGLAVYRWENGIERISRFENGYAVGIGKETYPDGRVYIGHFKEDEWHGQGKLTYPNGDVYVGEFVWDKPHGQGKLTSRDGIVQEGEFDEGKLVR